MDLSALGLSAVLAVTPPAVVPGGPVPSSAPGAVPTVVARQGAALTGWADYLDAVAAADLVAVGEKHDEAAHHRVQAEVLVEMALRGRDMVVALEMATPDDQPTLDAFLAGTMSETDFAAWWDRTWGYSYALYRPIFDAARAVGIPVAGINAPRALVKEVARKGVAGLSPADRAKLPASIQESADARYRAYVEASLDGHGPMPPDRRARMIEVQAVWNETMGENAARLAATGRLVVVVAGQGHAFYGAGVPESAARRRPLKSVVVLPYPLDGGAMSLPDQLRALQDPASTDIALGDYFRLLP
ncbi:MAG: ChaN family lipoprotein [Elusimicrobiota bacterium]|nr:ChaN family lipoprotein [Elusimicrobiota bacterium]